MENVIIMPNNAASTPHYHESFADLVAENYRRAQEGRSFLSEVVERQGSGMAYPSAGSSPGEDRVQIRFSHIEDPTASRVAIPVRAGVDRAAATA